MQNRLTRRKKLANDKLRLLVNVLLILVVAGLNFEVIPNINTYIGNTSVQAKFSEPQVKANFTNQDLTKYTGKKIAVQVKATKKFNGKNKYLRLLINPADNTRAFAKNMQTSADFIVDQLHQNKLEPKEISLLIKNNSNFEQFGYSSSQFAALISQRYYAHDQVYLNRADLGDKVLHLLANLVTLISLIALVYLIIIPREKIIHY